MKQGFDGPGIYALYNKKQSKVYIGRSTNITKRFYTHKTRFSEKVHKDSDNPMYLEPVQDFDFLVLQRLDDETYEKYSLALEKLYTFISHVESMELYNRMPQNPASNQFAWTVILDLSSALNVRKNLVGEIKKATGHTPAENNSYRLSKAHGKKAV